MSQIAQVSPPKVSEVIEKRVSDGARFASEKDNLIFQHTLYHYPLAGVNQDLDLTKHVFGVSKNDSGQDITTTNFDERTKPGKEKPVLAKYLEAVIECDKLAVFRALQNGMLAEVIVNETSMGIYSLSEFPHLAAAKATVHLDGFAGETREEVYSNATENVDALFSLNGGKGVIFEGDDTIEIKLHSQTRAGQDALTIINADDDGNRTFGFRLRCERYTKASKPQVNAMSTSAAKHCG